MQGRPPGLCQLRASPASLGVPWLAVGPLPSLLHLPTTLSSAGGCAGVCVLAGPRGLHAGPPALARPHLKPIAPAETLLPQEGTFAGGFGGVLVCLSPPTFSAVPTTCPSPRCGWAHSIPLSGRVATRGRCLLTGSDSGRPSSARAAVSGVSVWPSWGS